MVLFKQNLRHRFYRRVHAPHARRRLNVIFLRYLQIVRHFFAQSVQDRHAVSIVTPDFFGKGDDPRQFMMWKGIADKLFIPGAFHFIGNETDIFQTDVLDMRMILWAVSIERWPGR